MQVRYAEDLASHDDPESCVGGREAVGEALTGEHAGGVLSRENFPSGAPTLWREAERQHVVAHHGECRPGSAWSRDLLHAWKPSARERGDPPAGRSGSSARAVRIGKAECPNPMMHGRWKSDPLIVPVKPPNKAAFVAAEAVEGRGGAKGNVVRAARTRFRAGQAYPRQWTAYVAPRGGIRRSG
jgi:RNA-directed DNA polymerase